MQRQLHKKFLTVIIFMLALSSYAIAAAKWQTFKFDSDIAGKLIQLNHYCVTHDIKLEDVFWANKINSSRDITAGTEIFLPENQNDMLAIWQHQGAWQPTALVPVTSEAAAKRAAGIETPKVQAPEVKLPEPTKPTVPQVPEVKLPEISKPAVPQTPSIPTVPENPAKPEINTSSLQKPSLPSSTEEIDLSKILLEHSQKSSARQDSIKEAIKESAKPNPALTAPNKQRASNNYNVPNNPIIILSPNGDPATGPMRLVISGDKVEVVKLPANAAPKRPSLIDLDHTFGTIPDYLQPYMTLPPKRAGDNNYSVPNLAALNGKMLWPVDGKVTSGFGPRGKRRHTGLDIPMPLNTPIRASKSGVVAKTGNNSTMGFRGYGNFVLLDHGGGIKTLYAHCSSVGVSEGMKIMQGQVIAYVGRTGRATTEHVHFEVRVNDKPVNPIPYLAAHPQVASNSKKK